MGIGPVRSKFAERGEQLKSGFAQRFGGFQGTPEVAGFFNADTNDMLKNVSGINTKTINTMISDALDQRINDTPAIKNEPTTTYSKAEMPSFGFGEPSYSNFLENIPTSIKLPTAVKEDNPVINAGAAFETTKDGMLAGLSGLSGLEGLNMNFNPGAFDFLQNIPQNNPLLQGFDTSGGGFNTSFAAPISTDYTEQEPTKEVATTDYEYQPPAEPESDSLRAEDFLPIVPLIGDMFTEKMDGIEETLESIDVIGTESDGGLDEVLESIDVIGNTQDEMQDNMKDEGSCCTRVSRNIDGLRSDIEDDTSSDDLWERFKRLYVNFYTGGKNASSVLRDINYEERLSTGEGSYSDNDYGNSSDLESIDVIGNQDVSVRNNSTMADTEEILRAMIEKENLTSEDDGVTRVQEILTPLIMNNNKTITTSKMGDSRTERVFTDDNTFNRLSSADSNHPQYNYGP